MPNARGAAEFALELPPYLPTGRYALRLVMPGTFTELGGAAVALEEFVPPQIAVTLAKLPERVKADEKLPAQVAARHLFGRPAAGLMASASVYLRAHDRVDQAVKERYDQINWPVMLNPS